MAQVFLRANERTGTLLSKSKRQGEDKRGQGDSGQAEAQPQHADIAGHPLGGQVPQGERLGLLATATVGEGGWVDLLEPIIVLAGEAFIVVPELNA